MRRRGRKCRILARLGQQKSPAHRRSRPDFEEHRRQQRNGNEDAKEGEHPSRGPGSERKANADRDTANRQQQEEAARQEHLAHEKDEAHDDEGEPRVA